MKPKYLGKLLGVAVLAMSVMAMMASAAGAATPKPGYGIFAGCQTKAENAEIATCVRSDITGGYFQMGSKNVPITSTISLVGGVNDSGEKFAFNKEGGLLPAKQKVPGGVIGLTGLTWLAEFLGIEALTLYAETQLAGTAKPFASPVQLPIKVHLINSALGNNCFVGSTANPIVLNLTTATTSPPLPNKPITGKEPEFAFDEATEIITANNGTFVDNSFSAPSASGCVLTLFGFIPISINGLVNSQSGLPSPAGKNATSQNFNLAFVEAARVY